MSKLQTTKVESDLTGSIDTIVLWACNFCLLLLYNEGTTGKIVVILRVLLPFIKFTHCLKFIVGTLNIPNRLQYFEVSHITYIFRYIFFL